MLQSNLSKVCYEHITAKFYWGHYLHFKIIINRDTGFFNATRLCRDCGKQFKNWNIAEATHILINEFRGTQWKVREPSTRFNDDEWQAMISGHPQTTQTSPNVKDLKPEPEIHHGTYLHPKLLLPLILWISPKMHIMTATIVEDFVGRAHERLEFKRLELETERNKLHEKFDMSLITKDEFNAELDKLEVYEKELDVSEYYKHCLELDAKEFKKNQNKTVVKSLRTQGYCFRLINKNWPIVKCEGQTVVHKIHTIFRYTTVCVQKRNLNKSMKRLHDKFPASTIVLDLPYHPKARIMNKLIKKDLGEMIHYRFNDLTSLIDEDKLVDNITAIYNRL